MSQVGTPPPLPPWPLGFVLILPTVRIATIAEAFATLAQPITCIVSHFTSTARRREALLPILQMRKSEAEKARDFTQQVSVAAGILI